MAMSSSTDTAILSRYHSFKAVPPKSFTYSLSRSSHESITWASLSSAEGRLVGKCFSLSLEWWKFYRTTT